MRFGVHIPVSKGTDKAVAFALERGCDTGQIFSSNPRAWAPSAARPEDDAVLRAAFTANDIGELLLHTPYVMNIGTSDPRIYERSVESLVIAAERAVRLDGWVIVHAGRSMPRDDALDRAAAAVLTSMTLVPHGRILVELTAGGPGAVAATIPEAAELLSAIGDDRVGLCLDTCHSHAAGYPLADPAGARAWLDEAEELVGLRRVGAIHANDSRDPQGSHRDRHWHLGDGQIGEAGLRTILSDARLQHAIVVCETPGSLAEDRMNVARARAYAGRANP